ncbi:MAG: LysR family transcriptional regulator [Proteobacteria bacterium]|nr:LysR family transcriptional regulator [Burkholderiales bacterium]
MIIRNVFDQVPLSSIRPDLHGAQTPMPSLTAIRLFTAAYEERSFSRAAAREHTTQPAVSQRIRALEDELGVKLLERSPSQVVATPAGAAYYRRAIDLLATLEQAGQDARRVGAALSGEVRVGLMPSLTRCCLAPALATFGTQHPQVTLRVTEAYSGALTELLRTGELDFAIVPAFEAPVGIRSRFLARTPELLVSRADGRYPSCAPVKPGQLQDIRLMLPGALNTRRQRIEGWLASNGASIAQRLELDSMYGTLDMIGRGDWVAILPGVMMAPEIADGSLSVCPLAEPPFNLDLVVIEAARRAPPPAAAAFLDELAKNVDAQVPVLAVAPTADPLRRKALASVRTAG